jgi:hypothetical protein
MPEKEQYFSPSRSYDVELKIKGKDYSQDLASFQIVSSLSSAYQNIILTLSLDPNDILVNNLLGIDPIELRISLLKEDRVPGERINFNLLYLKSDFQFSDKVRMSVNVQKDRTVVPITTLLRQPYKTMTTMVNDVFIGVKIRDILNSLVSKAGAKLKYDIDGENQTVIDQVCIPPTTLYKIIKEFPPSSDDIFDGFLDGRFGLFNGVPGVFCQHDNTVYVKNLTSKLQKNQTFTMYQLATDSDKYQFDMIIKEVEAGNTYYTYDPVDSDYSGNARFGTIASSIINIVKPKDTLYSTISQELKDVAKKYALVYENSNLPIDTGIERTRYYNEDTGYDKSQIPFNTRFGRKLSDLATLGINIERNLPILPLLNVGECVKFKPQVLEYNDLEGKYILWSSVLNFTYSRTGWMTTARVNLVRTNKKK